MFKVPEKYRVKDHPTLSSDESYGNNGCFEIPDPKGGTTSLWVLCSDQQGWEHVSVSGRYKSLQSTFLPTWDDMCLIKSLFWDDEDCVVQYHPPKSEYVNCHPHVLHLWKQVGKEYPMPPSIMVGPK